MKLKDFSIGDRIFVDCDSGRKFESTVGCIHEKELYLKHYTGTICPEHNSQWVCREKDGVVYSNGSRGKPLVKLETRPKLKVGDTFIFTKEMNEAHVSKKSNYDWSQNIGKELEVSNIDKPYYSLKRLEDGYETGISWEFFEIDDYLPNKSNQIKLPQLKVGDTFIFTKEMNEVHLKNTYCTWKENIGEELEVSKVSEHYYYLKHVGSEMVNAGCTWKFHEIDDYLPKQSSPEDIVFVKVLGSLTRLRIISPCQTEWTGSATFRPSSNWPRR